MTASLRPPCLLVAAYLLLCLLPACAARRGPPPGPRSATGPTRTQLAAADAHLRAGREDEAIRAYARVVACDRGSVPAHLRYVSALLAAGRRSEARSLYAERAGRPDATEVERVMAARLATDGSSSALRRVYALAAEREPGNVWWRLARAEIEIAEAEAWNRRRQDAIARGDRTAETEAHDQARGAIARAVAAIAQAQATGPEVAEVDLYRGFLRAVEGDLSAGAVARAAAYRAACAAFGRAVRRDRDLVEAWEGLGDVRLRTGSLRGSLNAYLAAVGRRPADPRLREAVGVVLHRIGRYREAAEQYRQAARLDPRSASPWLRLGDAHADDEAWEAALEAYAEALRRDPTALIALYKRAVVLEHQGRLGEARASYERYLNQGGDKEAAARRRIERILHEERGRGR